MKRVSFKKKKFVVAMLVLSIPVSLMTGCGRTSISGMVTKAVANKVVNKATDIVDIVEDVVPAASALVSSELYTNEYTEYVNEIKEKYDFEDVYTPDEYFSLVNEELEKCYQEDLKSNKDATPTKQVYSKTDDMENMGTMTFVLVKGLCEEVNSASSTASFYYYAFDEYYLEILQESSGYLRLECYAKIRSSALDE
jgi:hypothetical protein